jgi:imidazolonepropionase-like amidohydrolase
VNNQRTADRGQGTEKKWPVVSGQWSAKTAWLPVAVLIAGSAFAAANDSFVIRNADVFPVTGPEMKGVSILVEDGKIADIGAKIVAPKGMRVVDAKGMRVYPGMIDSGTELGLSEVSAERVTVDTTELGEFMPQLKALIAVNPESEHFGVVRVNGITSAITFPAPVSRGGGGGGRGGGAVQYIAGQAALIHTSGWTWEDMEIVRDAAIQLNFPSIRGRGGRGGNADFNPDEFAAALGGAPTGFAEQKRQYDQQIAKINDFFDAARQYQKERTGNAPGFKKDLKMEAMIPVLEGKVPVAVSASRARSIHDAVLFADKQHIKIVILEPHDFDKVGAELKAKNIPVILGRTEALPENDDAPYDEAFTIPAEAYKAGVKFAFGTFDNEFVRNIGLNAARAVAFGLPYDEALKAVTINAAEIWGASDRTGSIEKGKWADLIIATGDILDAPTEVKGVFIKGKEVELMNKQIRLYEKYKARP